jgi:hypothetical protein
MTSKIKAQAAAAPGELLGSIFFWTLGVGTPGVKRTEVYAALDDAGLDDRHLPDEEDRAKAAKRAVKRAAKDRGARVEVLDRHPGVIVWGAIEPSADGATQIGETVGHLRNKVAFARDTGQLLFDVPDELALQAAGLYEEWTAYLNGEDVRRAVKGYLHGFGAVPMTGIGGSYFVRPEYRDEAEAVCALVSTLGSSYAYTIDVHGGSHNAKGVGVAVTRDVLGQIDAAKAEIARWVDGDRNARDTTLEGRIEKYQDIKARVGQLAGVLEIETADLNAELDKLAAACRELLAPPAPEPDQVPDDPASSPSTPTPPARPAGPDNGDPVLATLARKNIATLRKMAREAGISPRGMNKAALVEAISAVME